jgi:hypothetical protein
MRNATAIITARPAAEHRRKRSLGRERSHLQAASPNYREEFINFALTGFQ